MKGNNYDSPKEKRGFTLMGKIVLGFSFSAILFIIIVVLYGISDEIIRGKLILFITIFIPVIIVIVLVDYFFLKKKSNRDKHKVI